MTEENKYELLKKEEKLRMKFEEKEKEFKQKQKEKEDLLREEYIHEIKILCKKLDDVKIENDRLRFENIDLKNNIEDYQNSKHESEIEFKKELLIRENEFEKFQKKIRELQGDIEELESKLFGSVRIIQNLS